MKQTGITWPKLRDSVGLSLLLLSVLGVLAFLLTVLLMVLKFFKLVWRKA